MKPSTAQVLFTIAGDLGKQIVPALPHAYLQGSAQLAAVLAIFAAQEAERGAAVRIAGNHDLRVLLAELAPLAGAGLQSELRAAAAQVESDYTISALDAAYARLSALLIALQEDLELRDDEAARGATARIWTVLSASAARREFHLPPG